MANWHMAKCPIPQEVFEISINVNGTDIRAKSTMKILGIMLNV